MWVANLLQLPAMHLSSLHSSFFWSDSFPNFLNRKIIVEPENFSPHLSSVLWWDSFSIFGANFWRNWEIFKKKLPAMHLSQLWFLRCTFGQICLTPFFGKKGKTQKGVNCLYWPACPMWQEILSSLVVTEWEFICPRSVSHKTPFYDDFVGRVSKHSLFNTLLVENNVPLTLWNLL